MSVIEVAIGPGREPGQYRVEVVRSPDGEASAVTDLDVDALSGRRGELEQAVLVSSVPTRKVLPEEQRIREVGQALFRALLGTGEVAGRYRAAAAVAAHSGEGLRVVLRIDDPALAGLPWEAMYDEALGSYVCRRNQLVRHVGVPSSAAPLPVTAPLRILGIVSSPRGLAPLDVDKEKDQLTRALARVTADGLVELVWSASATWTDLQDTLLSGEWHVVHFIGHGDFDAEHDEGVLALTGEDGRMHLVQASRLIDLLRQARPVPRLVVLNSCSGAATGVTDLFSGTAAALVRGGVSAVAAMQYEITDAAAVAFARGFYGAVARGRGVDEAVSSGRVAILGLSDRTLEWLTPVLYLRGQDSHLFTVGHGPLRPHVPHRLVRVLDAHVGGALSVAFGPDAALLASSGNDGVVRLWDTGSGTQTHALRGSTGDVLGVALSPEGSWLASAGSDGTVRLWDTASWTQQRILTGHAVSVWAVAFSDDGALLASVALGEAVRLWETASGNPLRILDPVDEDSMTDVAFSADATLVAATSYEAVLLWDTASGTRLASLTDHVGNVLGVAFSPDGTLLAGSCSDGTVQLWETTGWRQLRALGGHDDWVNSVAFSPDGTRLVTASDDQTVRLWETASGAQAGLLTGHTGRVWSAAFSSDGRLVASASGDGTVRLWG